MINVKIDDVVYEIPEKWDEVSITRWRSLNILQSYLKDDMNDEERLTFNLELISILTDIPYDTLLNIPGEYYKTIIETISFYFKDKLNDEPKKEIVVDGKIYKLIELNKLTLGDRANIDIIRDSDTLEGRIGRVMSILYRYDGEPDLNMEQRDEKELLFNENVSINDVWGTMIFFLGLIETYTNNTKLSSVIQKKNQMMKQMSWWKRIQMKMRLVIRNITIVWRIGSQKGRYWTLKKFSK